MLSLLAVADAQTPIPRLGIADRPTVFFVVVGFLATLVAIGWVFRKFSRDSRDYFCAGGRATWWLVGGSIFMQSFSAWTFTGAAGAAYQAGWSLVVMYGSGVVMHLVCSLGPAVWFRRLRVVTAADTIRLRFGPALEQFYSALQCVMGVLFSGVQLYSLAIFTSTLLGVDVRWIIGLLGIVVLFYTAISGAWAVLAADFIQALVLLPVSVLLTVVCLAQFGGIGGFLDAITRAGLHEAYLPIKSAGLVASLPGISSGYFTWGFFGAWYGYQTANTNSLVSAGKYLTVKDDAEARRAALLAMGLAAVGMCIFFIPPMAARLLIAANVTAMPLPNPTEGAYAAIAMHLLPSGLVGLVLVAMCAASMSSLDGGLTSLAGIVTQNIYPALCRRLGITPREGGRRLHLGKAINLCCALVVIACAEMMARFGSGGVFKLLLDILAGVLTPIVVPLMWGLLVRRVPRWGAAFAIVAGVAVSALIAIWPKATGAQPWSYQGQVFAIAATGTVAFFLSRLAWQGKDREMLAIEDEFFARRHRSVDFVREVGGASDGTQMKIVGIFGLVLGGLILWLLLPISSAGHAGKIVAVAASTGFIGALLFLASRRSPEK